MPVRHRYLYVGALSFVLVVALTSSGAADPIDPSIAAKPTTIAGLAAQAENPTDLARARFGTATSGPGSSPGAAFAATPPPGSSMSAQLSVYTTPDPTVAGSGAYIFSPVDLAAPPQVEVAAPDGTTTTTQAHAYVQSGWWIAALSGRVAGIYRVSVTASAADGSGILAGAATFEVVTTQQQAPAASSWRSVGPNSIGGFLAIDPQRTSTMYVASELTPVMWVSNDAGQTWREDTTLPVGAGYPTALVVDPADGSRLYLSINGSNGLAVADPTYVGKVFSSDDGGRHWTALALPDTFVSGLVIDPTGTTIAAATSEGVYVSHDRGGMWNRIEVPWPGDDFDGMTLIGDSLYVATFDGLYAIRGVLGAPQPPVPLNVPTSRIGHWVTGVAGDAHALYANSWADNLYISRDQGATWTPVLHPDGFVWALDDIDGGVYASTPDDLMVSRDQGATWQDWPDPAPQSVNKGVAIAGNTVYVSEADSGVYATTDEGNSYTRVGAPGIDVNALGIVDQAGGPMLLAATRWGVYATPFATQESIDASTFAWHSPGEEGLLNANVSMFASGGSMAYKVVAVHNRFFTSFTVQRSADAGQSWSVVAGGAGVAQAIYVNPADQRSIYVTAGSGMLVSRDGGDSWTTVDLPATFTVLAGNPVDSDQLYASGPSGLYESTDGGGTWAKRSAQSYAVIDVLASGRLVLGGGSLATSDDQGTTADPAATPPLDVTVHDLVASPINPSVVYAALDSFYDHGLPKGGRGVWRSSDGGRTWSPFNDGLDNLNITSLVVAPDGRHLYAGADAGGVFRVKLPATG